MMYGIFSAGSPTVNNLLQAYKSYGVRRILCLDRQVAAETNILIRRNNIPMQIIPRHMDPGNTAQARSLVEGILGYNISQQNPLLICCRLGQDRTGFAIAAFLVRTGRINPCGALDRVNATHGYGKGLTDLQRANYRVAIGCREQEDTTEEENPELQEQFDKLQERGQELGIFNADDAVTEMREEFPHQQGGVDAGTVDAGWLADHPWRNIYVGTDVEGPLGSRAAKRLIRRIIRIARMKTVTDVGENLKVSPDIVKDLKKSIDRTINGLKTLRDEVDQEVMPEAAIEQIRDYTANLALLCNMMINGKSYTEGEKQKALLDINSDVNDAFLEGGPPGSPTAEAPPSGTGSPAIPNYIAVAERRRKRREKLLKILSEMKEEESLPEQPKMSDVGLSHRYEGGQIANTFNTPSGAGGAPNAASPSEPAGYVQL